MVHILRRDTVTTIIENEGRTRTWGVRGTRYQVPDSSTALFVRNSSQKCDNTNRNYYYGESNDTMGCYATPTLPIHVLMYFCVLRHMPRKAVSQENFCNQQCAGVTAKPPKLPKLARTTAIVEYTRQMYLAM